MNPQKLKIVLFVKKTDHVPTVTNRGNLLIINYFACDKFVKMSPKERFNELKSKNLCFNV